ncbi:MAG: Ppx/GppA family phosphatase, partial [Desulfobacterota bacterium]|nr:Ppx/GppA family phosphatase [Thermodesulfobacteriota bacterium]
MKRIATIDVGTNTVRLLIADYDSGDKIFPVVRKEVITRLGGNFFPQKIITPAASERTIAVLRDFKKLIDEYKPEMVIAVGTSVIRESTNRANFIAQVQNQTGIKIIPISGEIEAKISSYGALLPVNCYYDQAFIFDIGGGSTEFILTQKNTIVKLESVPLGVVHLSEKYFFNDPPTLEELDRTENLVREKIWQLRENFQKVNFYPFKSNSKVILIGIAGTPTTIAAIDLKLTHYDQEKVTNHLLEFIRIKEIFRKLVVLKADERSKLPGLQKGREDLIIPGIIITMAVMEAFSFSQLQVIDSGLLEGLILFYSSSGRSMPC